MRSIGYRRADPNPPPFPSGEGDATPPAGARAGAGLVQHQPLQTGFVGVNRRQGLRKPLYVRPLTPSDTLDFR